METCKKCGKELEPGARFCVYCGAEVETDGKNINPNSENEEKIWHFQKAKMLGLITYKRVFTDVSIKGNEINIVIKKGKKEKKKQETHQLISNLESIESKTAFDFWDTLYAIIFGIVGVLCICMGIKGAIGSLLFAAVCAWSGYGKKVIFMWKDGSKTVVPTENSDINSLLQYIDEYPYE